MAISSRCRVRSSVRSSDYKETVDQCRYICQGSETVVFRLDDSALETEEMISVETGKPYKQLPTAFAYRDRVDFKACDFQSYYRRVEEARARTVTPSDMKNALIPLPRISRITGCAACLHKPDVAAGRGHAGRQDS